MVKALILAGGESRRFGEDKALYKVKGEPMIKHVIKKLRESKFIDWIGVVASKRIVYLLEKHNTRKLIDEYIVDDQQIGPAGGVMIGVKRVGDAFITGCDMIFLNPRLIDYVIEFYLKYRDSFIAYTPSVKRGFIEPLHTMYTYRVYDVLREGIKSGDRSIQRILLSRRRELFVIEVCGEEWVSSLRSINTKRDLENS